MVQYEGEIKDCDHRVAVAWGNGRLCGCGMGNWQALTVLGTEGSREGPKEAFVRAHSILAEYSSVMACTSRFANAPTSNSPRAPCRPPCPPPGAVGLGAPVGGLGGAPWGEGLGAKLTPAR